MILRITPKGDTVALIDEQSGKKYIYEKESIYYPKNNNDGTLSIMNSLTNRPEIDSLPASNWRSSNGNVIATGPDPLINGNFVYLGLTTAFNPPLAPPPNNLGNLNDVNLDGLSLGNVISYNAFNQSWENIPRLSASDFTSSSLTISGGNGLPISLEGGGQWTDINNDIYYINPDAIDRGYVGIGTSSPAEKLDVSGNAVIRGGLNINDQFTFPSVDGSTGQVLSTNGSGVVTWVDQSGGDLWTESGSNIYYNGGNVGIGTTTPTDRLDVSGNLKLVNTQDYIKFANDLNTIKRDGANAMRFDSYGGFKFHDTSNNAERVRIDASGNVGIGTTAPESSLHIAGTTGITMGRNSAQNQVARVYADAGDNLILTAAGGSGKVIKLNNYVFGSSIDWSFTNSTGNKLDFTFNPNGWGGSNAPSLASFNSSVGYSTGDWKMVKIENTLNQTGDAAFTDLFINRTENSTGTGNQLFIDAQTNSVSKFSVNSQGKTYSSGGLQTIGDSYGNTVFMGQKGTYFTIESSHVGDMMRFYPNANKIQTVQPLAVGNGAPSSTDQMALKHWDTTGQYNLIKAQKQDGSDAFFLKSDGKVGIGTATPSEALHVVGKVTINDGSNNVLISSGNSTITASNTTAVGYQALTSLTTGTGNTAIGYQAGNNILAGVQNTLVGYNATIANQNGAYNVIVGDSVATSTGGNYATRVGSIGAVGNQAVSIGYGAGSTSGNGVIAIGYNAGKGAGGTFNSFIGTSAGEVSVGSNSVGVGYLSNRWTTGGNNVAIGNKALLGDNTSTFSNTVAVGYQALTNLTTGASNTAVGYRSGVNLSTGTDNTLVGYEAGIGLTSGNYNTFIGQHAGEANTTSVWNTAIGAISQESPNNGYNVSIGVNALRGNIGTKNVSIGTESGRASSAGSNNIFLGYQAGYNETGSNKLYIENSNSSSPLIYGEFDNDILRVNGTLQVGDPTGTGFKLPTTDGTTGQVLSTDGSGAVTWVDQSGGASDAEIQLAYKTTDQTLTTTFTAITAWDGEYYDDQAAFDPTTGTLTITQAGTYFIQADVVTYCTVGTSRSSSEVYLEFNGSEVAGSRRGMYNRLADNGTTSASIAFPYKHTTGTATFKLIAGQIAGSDTVVVSNAFFSSITLGGAQGAQGVSGDAFQVASETSGRTLVAGDHLNYIRNTSATAVTYTVPPQSSVSWVDNAEIVFEQAGAGQITIAAGSGVTINSSETLKSGQQYAVIGLKRVASDVWTLTGEREAL